MTAILRNRNTLTYLLTYTGGPYSCTKVVVKDCHVVFKIEIFTFTDLQITNYINTAHLCLCQATRGTAKRRYSGRTATALGGATAAGVCTRIRRGPSTRRATATLTSLIPELSKLTQRTLRPTYRYVGRIHDVLRLTSLVICFTVAVQRLFFAIISHHN